MCILSALVGLTVGIVIGLTICLYLSPAIIARYEEGDVMDESGASVLL